MDRRSLLQLTGGAAVAWSAAPARVWAATPSLSPAARLEIEELASRWVWAMDTGDAPALLACMTSDAVVTDRRGNRMAVQDFARTYASESGRRGRIHEAQINRIWTEGALVRMSSYWATVNWTAGAPAPVIDALGVYTDTIVRRGGRYLIGERVIGTWDSATAPVAKL